MGQNGVEPLSSGFSDLRSDRLSYYPKTRHLVCKHLEDVNIITASVLTRAAGFEPAQRITESKSAAFSLFATPQEVFNLFFQQPSVIIQ